MAAAIPPSGIRRVFDRAAELERSGRSIVHLEIGRPHLSSPAVAAEAAADALRAGQVHYTASRGTIELRRALAEWLIARGAPSYSPDEELVVSVGASEALIAALHALLETGDEVLILEPCWPHYDGQVILAGGVPRHVRCAAADGFVPDLDAVHAAVTARTRVLIISSPCNPSGAVIDRVSLDMLAALCLEHDLHALSDETYAAFVYDEQRHHSIASCPGMRSRTVLVDSFSKTFAMTGWRVGWVAAPAPLCARITAIHQHLTVCAPSFAQVGALAALRGAGTFLRAMRDDYQQRRDTLNARLHELPGVELVRPAGALYAFPRVAPVGDDAGDVAMRLLEEAGVASVPGAVFGAGYEAHLRLSFAVSAGELDEGLRRIERFLASSHGG